MATTTNGIYYPNDYDSVADIPADMKKIAESVDTKIAENKTEINNIKTEQTTQNTNISNLQKDNTTNKQDITEIKAKDTEQDKYISELEAENARLRQDLNGLPKGQASGESIDLSDSAEMRCDLKISGNSKQETREGYNSLDLSNLTSITQNGITATKNEDGSITFNGTATEGFSIYKTTIDLTLPAGTYRNSIKTPIVKGIYISLDNIALTMINGSSATGSTYKEITLTEETTFTYYQIWIDSGTIFNNFTIYPMVYKYNGIDKDYEPYGASPSPDYPSEVESCGDNVNLFDLETWFNTVGSKDCTATLIKNGVKLDFVAGADVYLGDVVDPNVQLQESKRNSCIKVKPNTTYTIQMSSAPKCYISYLDSNYTGTRAYTAIYNNYSKYIMTFTTNETTEYIHIRLGLGSSYGGTTYTFTDIKLEEGTTPTPYTPYGQGCINEVICNKNKLDISKIGSIAYKNGIRNNGDLEYSINPTVDNRDWTYNSSNHFIDLKAGTYTLTVFFETKISKSGSGLSIYASTGKQLKFLTVYDVDKATTTFTIEEDTNIGIFFKIYDGKARLQLEEGTTATPYEEHKEQTYTIPTQQPFRAIGDTRDTFIKKNNKWFERHYIQRVIFDGTEDWYGNINSSGWAQNEHVFAFPISGIENNGQSTNVGIVLKSTHFKCTNTGPLVAYAENAISYYSAYKNGSIMVNHQNISNVTDFKTWLTSQYNAGTPVYVDYIAETPLDIECTEEQSTILFDIEQNAKTYDKVTHMYSTDEISPVIDVTYKKDIDTMITNIEQAILSQGGNI